MAIIQTDNYKPPRWLFNGHMETIYPAIFRKVAPLKAAEKEIVTTPDNDFFVVEIYDNNSNRTVIISHGLEGNSTRPYMLGMVNAFLSEGWNAIAWNYRGCNGKVNNSLESYHSGFTKDLELLVNNLESKNTDTLALIGFSLGGNMTLKFLAEKKSITEKLKCAVTFSVPLDLHAGCIQISKNSNMIYSKRFLKSLKKKVRDKARVFPDIETQKLSAIDDLKTFDDYYTAPLHGFDDALHYYQSCSALYVLDKIDVPTLIVNALNDPFLPKECYPFEQLEGNKNVYFQAPRFGGHVGFPGSNGDSFYWSEKRAVEFVNSVI